MLGGVANERKTTRWYTIDACFLSDSRQISSSGMFAGSCVGVICLVVLLEFLRRLAREYDAFLIREFQQRHASLSSGATSANASVSTSKPERDSTEAKWSNVALRKLNHPGTVKQAAQFRPNFIQQAMRAHLHMLQFAVAYFIMLLAMYYNG